MADGPTLGVNLGGLITTSGAVNSAFLQSLANFITAQGFTFESLSKTQLPAPANVFVTLTDDPTAPITGGVNTGGNAATVTGGQSNSGVFSQGTPVNYVGAAAAVFVADGSGSVFDTGAAASIAALDGLYTVVGQAGDKLLLGGAAASVTAFSGGTSATTLEGGVLYSSAASDTITATAGTSTVFGAAGTSYTGSGATVLFIGLGSASTVLGGGGADTVYGDGTTFVAGSGNKVFAGSVTDVSTASTVYAGASGGATIQAGVHGDLIYLQGSTDRVVSGGGQDTIWGQSGGVAPTIFGSTGSYELLVSDMKGGLALGMGDNTTLDGANTSGGLTYFANPGFGNQTFIGSASGADSFYIGAQNVGTSLITIEDWHSDDSLNLSAFGTADQATATAALTGGSGLFKLSDGTTVSFVGNHPTSANGSFYS